MDKAEYKESRKQVYEVIRKARSEVERIQFVDGLHNDLTESVKRTLIDIENKILNDKVKKMDRQSTIATIEMYKMKAKKTEKEKHGKTKRVKAMNKKAAKQDPTN